MYGADVFEAPRSAWLEQVHLAERIGSGPKLMPEDPAALAEVAGLCHLALASPGGLAFEKRSLGSRHLRFWSSLVVASLPKQPLLVLKRVYFGSTPRQEPDHGQCGQPFRQKVWRDRGVSLVERLRMAQEMIKLAPQRLVALLNHVHGVLEKQKAKARV